jgi:hypothetical protein
LKRALWALLAGVFVAAAAPAARAAASQDDLPAGGRPVLPADALLTTPVGGLERTGASAAVVPVPGQPFARALRVVIGAMRRKPTPRS